MNRRQRRRLRLFVLSLNITAGAALAMAGSLMKIARACNALVAKKLDLPRDNVRVEGSYKEARGCAPSLTGMSAEEAIRRARDHAPKNGVNHHD